jgi:hypothetical protein
MRQSRAAGRHTGLRVGLLGATCALIGTLAMSSVAFAAGPTFSLQVTRSHAPYFVLAGRPGTTVTGRVTVSNVGGSAGGVSLYATDATTGQTTGAVYRSPQEPRRDVGAWIELARHHLRLGPGQPESVPFRVAIPDGSRAGQHLGGIVAQPDQPRATITSRRGGATFHIQVRELAVIAVELNLPGPLIHRLEITGIRPGAEPGYQTLLIGLASTGTALTKGDGTIAVSDEQGRPRLRRSFTLDTFVPDSQIQYPVRVIGSPLPPGNYRAAIMINDARQHLRRVLPFAIASQNVPRPIGARRSAQRAASGPSIVLLIIAGLALLLVGFTLGARARARPAKP